MPIISFYILRAFAKPFVMSLIFFTGLIIITNFFRRTGLLIDNQLPPLIMIAYLIYQIPSTIMLITPVAVLLACLISLGNLAHHNEIIAMKSSGVNLYRLMLPILLSVLLISFLAIGWNEFVVPKSYQKMLMIKSQKIYRERISYQAENLSFRSDKGWFLMVKSFDKEKGIMGGIDVNARYPDGHISLRIEAKRAKWINNTWWLEEGILRRFSQQGITREEKFEKKRIDLWSPEQIWMIYSAQKKKSDEMNMIDLKAYIKLLKESGSKFNDRLVDLHLKVSFPFANLIIALIGTSLALQRPKGARAASFGISILISFLYWEAMGLGRALGMAEKLPPMFSAWIPNIIFGIIGLYLAVKAKK